MIEVVNAYSTTTALVAQEAKTAKLERAICDMEELVEKRLA